MTDVAKENYMIDLDIMLKDPNAIKSIISQDFTSDGLDFSDVVFDETDVQATRDQVKNIMIQSFSDVASEGAAEKRRKNPIKDDRTAVQKATDDARKLIARGVNSKKQFRIPKTSNNPAYNVRFEGDELVARVLVDGFETQGKTSMVRTKDGIEGLYALLGY